MESSRLGGSTWVTWLICSRYRVIQTVYSVLGWIQWPSNVMGSPGLVQVSFWCCAVRWITCMLAGSGIERTWVVGQEHILAGAGWVLGAGEAGAGAGRASHAQSVTFPTFLALNSSQTQAVLYVQQEPYRTNQLIFKSANISIATSICRSIKNLDPFLYYKFLRCIFLCWIFCAVHLSLLHLRLYKSSLQRIFWQPYHTAVRLHVYLDFVKSIEQELKIQ